MTKMATAAYVLLDLLGAIALVAIIWRVASRGCSVPCPASLSWLVELDNPFTRTNRAAVNRRQIGSRTGHGSARCRLWSRPADDPDRKAGRPTGRSRGRGYASRHAAARSRQSAGRKPHQYPISPSRRGGGEAGPQSL